MQTISTREWESLHALAQQLGVSSSRVGLLQRQLDRSRVRPASPYILLAATQQSRTLEWLLGRWIGPQAAEQVKSSQGAPLVIGREPERLQPPVGSWPVLVWPQLQAGHILALQSAQAPTAETIAQLQSLGFVDQVVLVSRFSQPLTDQERRLARLFAPLAATGRVLLVGLPSDAPDPDLDNAEDVMAKQFAYAQLQMRDAGYHAARYQGLTVWFTDGVVRAGSSASVEELLAVDGLKVAQGTEGMVRQGMAALVHDLAKRAAKGQTGKTALQLPISEAEQKGLVTQFTNYLDTIEREVEQLAIQHPNVDAERLRAFVLDTLHNWGSYQGSAGSWLKLVESLRPGTQAALMEEARAALPLLDYNSQLRADALAAQRQAAQAAQVARIAHQAAPPTPEPERSLLDSVLPLDSVRGGLRDLLAMRAEVNALAKRSGVALAVGLLSYLLVAALLSGSIAPSEIMTDLPPLVKTLLSYAALVIGLALGYTAAHKAIRSPMQAVQAATQSQAQNSAPPALPAGAALGEQESGVVGWVQVERRLLTWFHDRLRAESLSPKQEVALLAQRLGVDLLQEENERKD